jgi:phosphohistidine phosphatase
MDLILWRHADAEDGEPDLERRLTARGRRHAARVAGWLLQRLPSKFSVVAGPSERTCQTAHALGVPFKACTRITPASSVADLLRAVQWPERRGTVIVVGHQPALGQVASLVVSGTPLEWAVKKGGLWWLTNRMRNDAAQVVVRAVVTPDLL